MRFLFKCIFALIFFLSITIVGECAVCGSLGNDPRFEKIINHNVLASGEIFKATKLAKKARCGYVVIKSQYDLAKIVERNTIYCIKTDLNLQGELLLIPSGCLLYFDGGSFRNGKIKGNGTMVVAEDYEIFKHGISTYRAYNADTYKFISKHIDAIVIEGTWLNKTCGSMWTGLSSSNSNQCASLAINNYVKLHKRGRAILFPTNGEYYVYDRIICSGYSVDFNNSIIRSIDFSRVEDHTIILPAGTQPRSLKSLYGLLEFNGDNAYIKNLTIDGRASQRNEIPSLGTECLMSMGSNVNCQLKNIKLIDAVGCGICTYAISDCSFDDVVFNGCGEHGLYTHAYKGTLSFNDCGFINCGQDSSLFKQRGASACVKLSGARDQEYAALKDLKAFFSNCSFESTSQYFVATFYSDIPYAEFNRCKWKGVKGYSIVSPKLAEQIGRLVEFRFVDCDNPCYSIQSVNTIRRLIRCKNVTSPFDDTIELKDCEINVEYADVDNNYSSFFASQYDTPVVCTNCRFVKGLEDTPIRNTIKNPRPMLFNRCTWEFAALQTTNFRGSYFLVLANSGELDDFSRSVTFKDCKINLANYRMLYCHDTDVAFLNCEYIDSYDTLIDAQADRPNRVHVSKMTNRKKKEVARNSIIINEEKKL